MEFNEVLNYILYTVLTIIFPVVTAYVVNLIKTKIRESNVITELTKNETAANLIENALSNVMDAVLYVNQVYVDALKSQGEFNEESQKIAFNKAYEKALSLISDGAKSTITELYGSFERWLETKIEVSVNVAKK